MEDGGRGLCKYHYHKFRKDGTIRDYDGNGHCGMRKKISFKEIPTKGTCKVAGCEAATLAQGLCQNHYHTLRRHGVVKTDSVVRVNGGFCKVEGCDNVAIGKGYCSKHYNRLLKHGSPDWEPYQHERIVCKICGKPSIGQGYCPAHYSKYQKYGDPLYASEWYKKRGEKKIMDGYVMVYAPKHPRARMSRVLEHRLIIEKKIGRYLLPNESVHHINGIKTDNRPENLELWIKTHPSGQRPEDLVMWAENIIELYGHLVKKRKKEA